MMAVLRVGPVREPELEQLVEQLKNMGFDEVSSTVCLSVCLSVSLRTCQVADIITSCCLHYVLLVQFLCNQHIFREYSSDVRQTSHVSLGLVLTHWS